MKKILIALFAAIAITLFLGDSSTVSAAECIVDGRTVPTSFDFGCPADGENTVSNIIIGVINFLSIGVGIAVVVGIVIGGIRYASSNGDAALAKAGKDMIFNAIIALFLFIFLFAAVNFLVPGGLFN